MYMFAIEVGGTSYTSATDFVKRHDGQCTDSSSNKAAAARFSRGTMVRCWRPSDGTDAQAIGYSCSNPSCYRVFSPHEEAARKQKNSSEYVKWGAILLAFYPAVITAGFCYVLSQREAGESTSDTYARLKKLQKERREAGLDNSDY